MSSSRMRRDSTEVEESPVAWKKVLYEDQPFPDNYTDGSFLEHLVLNVDVQQRNYWEVVYGTTTIVQQLCIAVAAVVIPSHLSEGRLSVQVVILLNLSMLALGYLMYCLASGHIIVASLGKHIRQYGLLVAGVYLQAPLLMSLARTISSDTIIACTVVLMLLHLYLFDYRYLNANTESLKGRLSLGSAVGASVLLSSRLESRDQVFAYLVFSLELHLFSPFVRRYLRATHETTHVLATAGIVLAASALLVPLALAGLMALLGTVVFVMFICPMWLMRIQKYKQKINGPWDEAEPKLSTSVDAFQRSMSRRISS